MYATSWVEITAHQNGRSSMSYDKSENDTHPYAADVFEWRITQRR